MGKGFVYEYFGFLLDIIIVVKGLGNGFLVGVVIGKKQFGEVFISGFYGMIFGGNMLVMVVVNVIL